MTGGWSAICGMCPERRSRWPRRMVRTLRATARRFTAAASDNNRTPHRRAQAVQLGPEGRRCLHGHRAGRLGGEGGGAWRSGRPRQQPQPARGRSADRRDADDRLRLRPGDRQRWLRGWRRVRGRQRRDRHDRRLRPVHRGGLRSPDAPDQQRVAAQQDLRGDQPRRPQPDERDPELRGELPDGGQRPALPAPRRPPRSAAGSRRPAPAIRLQAHGSGWTMVPDRSIPRTHTGLGVC